jgi:hypothetical protein
MGVNAEHFWDFIMRLLEKVKIGDGHTVWITFMFFECCNFIFSKHLWRYWFETQQREIIKQKQKSIPIKETLFLPSFINYW